MANEQNLRPFKKGQSGNLDGKPKGVQHSKTRLKKLLEITEEFTNPISGEVEGFTLLEQMDLQQIHKALNGDTRAYQVIIDRLEGSVQKYEPPQDEGKTTGLEIHWAGCTCEDKDTLDI